MLTRLLPKQVNFFNLFQESAFYLVNAAHEFHKMQKDLANADQYAKLIAEHEMQGDNIARNTYDLLHKTFITPFDRYDMLELVRRLDDILDLVNRTAKRIAIYKMQNLPEGMQDLSALVVEATTTLQEILVQLRNLKNSEKILENCLKVNSTESRADSIKMSVVAKLFAEENDFKQLLKTREIIDYSKMIVSECHHLANIIKGIVLEYS